MRCTIFYLKLFFFWFFCSKSINQWINELRTIQIFKHIFFNQKSQSKHCWENSLIIQIRSHSPFLKLILYLFKNFVTCFSVKSTTQTNLDCNVSRHFIDEDFCVDIFLKSSFWRLYCLYGYIFIINDFLINGFEEVVYLLVNLFIYLLVILGILRLSRLIYAIWCWIEVTVSFFKFKINETRLWRNSKARVNKMLTIGSICIVYLFSLKNLQSALNPCP